MIIPPEDTLMDGQSYNGHRYVGHSHFWERAMLSRRQFMMTAAGCAGYLGHLFSKSESRAITIALISHLAFMKSCIG